MWLVLSYHRAKRKKRKYQLGCTISTWFWTRKLFQHHINQLHTCSFPRWESSALILNWNSFFSKKNTADYFTCATSASTSIANIADQLNVRATLNLSFERAKSYWRTISPIQWKWKIDLQSKHVSSYKKSYNEGI